MTSNPEKVDSALHTPASNEDAYPVDEKKSLPHEEKHVPDVETLSPEGAQPLETAEDIVTHVIQVDDDPSMNPWTARMFIVGKFIVQSYILHIDASTDRRKQALDCLHLVASYRRLCTSSRRSSTFRSCSLPSSLKH